MAVSDQHVEEFLRAIRSGDAVASAMLSEHPDIGGINIFTAAAAGEADIVADFLARDVPLGQATHGREEWPPLAYACRSELHATSGARAAGLQRVAATLLN